MMKRTLALAAAGALTVALFPATPATAQAIQVITNYPFVSVEAGKSATFNIQVITSVRQRVNFEVVEIPSGWRATLRGGGFVVHGVTGDEENPPPMDLDITVPEETEQGDYRVLLRGTTAGGVADTLELTLRVEDTVEGAVALTADFPELRGASDATFNYTLTLTNNSPEETRFALRAQGPEDWIVQARPSAQQQAATVNVEGGGTATIDVQVDPPDVAAAGNYDVQVFADAGAKSAEITLKTEIIGNVSLTVTTPDEVLNTDAVAGRSRELTIQVRNEGTSEVGQVSLEATPPADWEVTFEPETIESIPPGGAADSTATITPTGEAVAGDYVLTVRASAEATTDDVEIRVTVETSRIWGIVGILIILLAAFILLSIFRRFGRR